MMVIAYITFELCLNICINNDNDFPHMFSLFLNIVLLR